MTLGMIIGAYILAFYVKLSHGFGELLLLEIEAISFRSGCANSMTTPNVDKYVSIY